MSSQGPSNQNINLSLSSLDKEIEGLKVLLSTCRIRELFNSAEKYFDFLNAKASEKEDTGRLKIETLYFLARAYIWQGYYSKALQKAEIMKGILDEVSDPEAEIKTALAAGIAVRELGKYERAKIDYLEPALSKCRKLNHPGLLVECLAELSIYERYTRDDRKSLELIQEALNIAEKLGEENLTAECLYYKAILLDRLGDTEQAIADNARAFELYDKTGNPRGRTRTLRKAASYIAAEDDEKALSYLESAIKIADVHNDRIELARCASSIGMSLMDKEEGKASLECLRKAEAILSEIEVPIDLAEIYINFGLVYDHHRMYDAAISQYKKGLELTEPVPEYFTMGDITLYLGLAYFNQDNFEEALTQFSLSVQYFLEPGKGKKSDLAMSTYYVALTEMELENYENALKYFDIARDGYERINDKVMLGEVIFQIAKVHWYQDENASAKKYFQKALNIEEENGNHERLLEILENLESICFGEKDYEEAIRFIRRNNEISKMLGKNENLANNFHSMGNAYYNMGKYDDAITYYKAALGGFMELSDKGKLVEAGIDLGDAYQKNGDSDKALEILHVTLNVNKKEAYKLELIHRIYEAIGDIYYESDDYKKAAESYMAAAVYAKPYNQEESEKTEEEWREVQARNSYWAGECFYMIDGEAAAVPHYKEALQSYEMLGNEEKVAFINLRLGTIYSRFSDGKSEALGYFDKAREYYVRTDVDGKEELPMIYESMGYLWFRLKNENKALMFFQLAQVCYENLKDHEGRDRVIESIQQVKKIGPYI